MNLTVKPKRHRFPAEIIGFAVWSYHRFNDSLRDMKERLAYRGIDVSHETIRDWCKKFGPGYHGLLKGRMPKPKDKWHLDEMVVKVNGESFILWRAVDCDGLELDVYLQKRKNKRAASRFLTRLLGSYPLPRVIVTDKLRSYKKPIQKMAKTAEHRTHKRLNNRAENAHQPTRRKEKCVSKYKSPAGVQKVIELMGKVRNLFALFVRRYSISAKEQRQRFIKAKNTWNEISMQLLCA